jgi:hypothetical protein
MAYPLFNFTWTVASHGYEWRQVEPSAAGRLNDAAGADWVLVASSGQASRSYEPLQDATGLFRAFASTAPKRNDVLEFATAYGLLGTEPYLDHDPREVADVGSDQVVGERLPHWIAHILVMRDAVDVWDLVATRDEAGLRRLQRSRKLFTDPSAHRLAEPAAVEPQHDVATNHGFEHRLDYYRAPRSGLLLRDAWGFVMDAVDQHLEETGVKMTMKWDATRRSARFYVAPTSLLAAMWVQFAEAISEQKDYERCRLCGKPFEVSTAQEGARTNRRFCSDEHKNQFHYRKRIEARKLRDEGATLKDIATQFEVTVPAVKKWLADASGTRPKPGRKS